MADLIVVKSRIPFSVLGRGIPERESFRSAGAVLPFRCRLRGDDTSSGGRKEPLEALFAKELKRRGIVDPASSSSNSQRVTGLYPPQMEEIDFEEEQNGARDPPKKKRVASADHESGLSEQWGRSMALNSEHLEGLIPRAKLILTTGVTLFVGFWPLILLTMGIFSAMDHYLGPRFVHVANKSEVSGPPRLKGPRPPHDERSAPRVE